MVDASRKDASEKKKTGVSVKFKKGIKIAVFAAVVAGAGYGLWKNPQVAEQVKNWLGTSAAAEEKENETAVLREEVRDLRVQLNNLQRQFYEQQDNSVLMEKFANLERYNLNVINSKADVAAVLGLVMRMDKAEHKLEAVAGATDRGALVLTAAMLVKESADRGGSFEYEAEVLRQLASGNTELKGAVEEIVKTAKTGVATNQQLAGEFAGVYEKLVKKQREAFEQDWKDRLNNKISEYIKVKKVNEKAREFEENRELEQVKDDVAAGNIKKALFDLENINNKELLNEESLKAWMRKAGDKVGFNDAVNRISAYYLASLKVNFMKKETSHD